MKHKLYQITLSQLVDVYCGDGSVLLEEGEKPNQLEMEKARIDILLEYRSVVDAAGYKSALNKQKGSIAAKTKVTIFKMCINLIAIGGFDNVRQVYDEMKIAHRRMNDDELAKDVKRRLKSAEFDYKRNCDDNEKDMEEAEISTPEERRNAMIDDMSFVMTHFKFQIDPDRLNARAYATMRKSMVRELEMKKKSLNSLKSKRH